MATRGPGISGLAVALGAAGIWFVYAGIRDVPIIGGIGQLLRGEEPDEGDQPEAPKFEGFVGDEAGVGAAALFSGGQDTGIDRLVPPASLAYRILKTRYPMIPMHGYRAQGSVPGSDHPKGLAIDAMTVDGNIAGRMIETFKLTPGAKYWIWNREIATRQENWQPRRYSGPSPHTDHVHFSWSGG